MSSEWLSGPWDHGILSLEAIDWDHGTWSLEAIRTLGHTLGASASSVSAISSGNGQCKLSKPTSITLQTSNTQLSLLQDPVQLQGRR